jgi:hypothetical protein
MVGISGARILIIFPKPPLHRQTKAAFQREIEEYRVLSEQVMQLTNTICEGVEKIRASVDRPQCSKQLQ